MSDQYRIIEYPLILLFCIIGVIFLVLSSDLICNTYLLNYEVT